MGEACRQFDTPVTGGNVSFYNQGPDGAVYPTPTIGMVGVMDGADNKMTLNFKNAGDTILLLGNSKNDISSSEYLTKIIGEEYSPCPHFEVAEELRLQKVLLQLITDKKIESAHDVSEGGLMITLLESSFYSNKGFDVAMKEEIRNDAYWFGEAQSRVVISVADANVEAVKDALNAASQSFSILGTVTEGAMIVGGEDFGNVVAWKSKYELAIENIIAGKKN